MKSFFKFLIMTAVSSIAANSIAQIDVNDPSTLPHPSTMKEGVTYIITDGKLSIAPKPAPGSLDAIADQRDDRIAELQKQNSPINLLLGQMSVDELDLITAVELTAEQKKQLTEVVKEFRKTGVPITDWRFYRMPAILHRLTFADRVYDEILIEDQRKVMAKSEINPIAVFKLLTNKNVSKFTGVSDTEILSIQKKCELASEKIEQARAEYLEMILSNQAELQDILDTLDDEQAAKLKKLIGMGTANFFKTFDLPAMSKAAKLTDEKE